MSHTDPIADMLSRLKNAIMAEKKNVPIPLSGIKQEIAKVLKKEGYINGFKLEKQFPARMVIDLKYSDKKGNVIAGVKRISKPGRRVMPVWMRYPRYSADWEWHSFLLPMGY